jgi:hypothetical protein
VAGVGGNIRRPGRFAELNKEGRILKGSFSSFFNKFTDFVFGNRMLICVTWGWGVQICKTSFFLLLI